MGSNGSIGDWAAWGSQAIGSQTGLIVAGAVVLIILRSVIRSGIRLAITAGVVIAIGVWAYTTSDPVAYRLAASALVGAIASDIGRNGILRRVRRAVIATSVTAAVLLPAGWWSAPCATGDRCKQFSDVGHSIWHQMPLVAGGLACLIALAVVARKTIFRGPKLDPRRTFSKAQYQQVVERDGEHCVYCGASPNERGVSLAMDHVEPHAGGGRTEIANAQLLCTVHNGWKSNHSDAEARATYQERTGEVAGSWKSVSRH